MNLPMYLFCVSQPVYLLVRERQHGWRIALQCDDLTLDIKDGTAGESSHAHLQTLRPHGDGRVTEASLYLSFSRPFLRQLADLAKSHGGGIVRLLNKTQQRRVLSGKHRPIQLGNASPIAGPLETQLGVIDMCSNTILRVGVINVCASALGDSIVAVTALREFRKRLLERFSRVEITSFQHPDNLEAEQLYLKSGVVDDIVRLPTPLSSLAAQDAYVDLSTPYMEDPSGNANSVDASPRHWLDGTLAALGMDPAGVAASVKRNRLPVDKNVQWELAPDVQKCRSLGLPLVLFHPRAFVETRSMPNRMTPELLAKILERRQWIVVSVVPIAFAHPRFIDWSHLSASFEHLNALVSAVDAFISVDTSVSHIADAHSIPGVVLYTWAAHESRIAYYPYIEGVRLPQDHGVTVDSPDPRAISRIDSAWQRLDVDAVFGTLDHVIDRARSRGA